MDDPVFESPLAHAGNVDNSFVELRELTERGMIDVRGRTTDRKFLTAVKSVLSVDLPKTPRTSSAWGDVQVLWLSIDQWLIICPRNKAEALTTELHAALSTVHSLVVNVSDMRAIIRIEGQHARQVLMKGTSTHLMGEEFVAGSVKRMRFAEIAALFHIVQDDVIDLYVFRSYAQYAWDFLLKAARKGSEVKQLSSQS